MSAEPAHPGPDDRPPGTVILFRTPAARPPRRTGRRGIPNVSAQPGPGPAPEMTPQQRMAVALEKRFAGQGQSLTDSETAQAFLCTLREVRTMLHGALAEGRLGEGEHQTLDAMVEGMMAAPDLLA
jgi:hypothetical protein